MEFRLPQKTTKKSNSYNTKLHHKIVTLEAMDSVFTLQLLSSNTRFRAVEYPTIPEYSATLLKRF
jgi:hypothetical protein